MSSVECKICNHIYSLPEIRDQTKVPGNIEKCKSEWFTVWRCENCRSLHCYEQVDLDAYYAGYPLHSDSPWQEQLKTIAKIRAQNLKKLGLDKQQTILDYGCGGGYLLTELKRQGFNKAVGYDAYDQQFNHPELLDQSYDFIFCGDVIEHVHDPKGLLHELSQLLVPGGILVVGTPNAEYIDLKQADKYAASLEQPYHLHMMAESTFLSLASENDLECTEIWRRHIDFHAIPFMPFANERAILEYMRLNGNYLEAGYQFSFLKALKSPSTLFFALFGYFFPLKGHMTVVFRKREADA